MSCGSLDGRGVWARMDSCIWMAESLRSSPETITTLLIGYTPIQPKKFKEMFGVHAHSTWLWKSELLVSASKCHTLQAFCPVQPSSPLGPTAARGHSQPWQLLLPAFPSHRRAGCMCLAPFTPFLSYGRCSLTLFAFLFNSVCWPSPHAQVPLIQTSLSTFPFFLHKLSVGETGCLSCRVSHRKAWTLPVASLCYGWASSVFVFSPISNCIEKLDQSRLSFLRQKTRS